jgi:hypothetical protein
MKGQMMRMAVVTLLVFGLSVAGAATQKPAKTQKVTKPQVKTYTGTVKVTKDKAGRLTAVKLSTGLLSPTYNVALDKQGRELAEKMAGKRVQVQGLVAKKSGKTVLTVREYSPVAPKSTKKAAATKPAKPAAPKSTTNTPKR